MIPPCCPQAEGGSVPCRQEQHQQGDGKSGLQYFKPSRSQSSPKSPVSLAPKGSSSFTKPQVTFRWIQPSCGRLETLSLQGWSSASLQNKGVGVGVGKSGPSDCPNKSGLPGTILPKARRGHRGFGAVSLWKSYTTHWAQITTLVQQSPRESKKRAGRIPIL